MSNIRSFQLILPSLNKCTFFALYVRSFWEHQSIAWRLPQSGTVAKIWDVCENLTFRLVIATQCYPAWKGLFVLSITQPSPSLPSSHIRGICCIPRMRNGSMVRPGVKIEFLAACDLSNYNWCLPVHCKGWIFKCGRQGHRCNFVWLMCRESLWKFHNSGRFYYFPLVFPQQWRCV